MLILPGRAVGADGAFNELNPRHITSCRPNGPTPKVAGRCWVPSTPTGTVVLRRCACLIRRLASLLTPYRLVFRVDAGEAIGMAWEDAPQTAQHRRPRRTTHRRGASRFIYSIEPFADEFGGHARSDIA